MIVTVNAVAVQFESSVVQDEIYATASFVSKRLDCLPKLVEVIAKNIPLRSGKLVTTCGLKGFDLFLGHVDKKREVCCISPKTNCERQGYTKLSDMINAPNLASIPGT